MNFNVYRLADSLVQWERDETLYDPCGSVWCRRHQIDGLVQERRNSSALAMDLRLSCINPSKDRLMQERRNSSASAMELRLSCINPSKWDTLSKSIALMHIAWLPNYYWVRIGLDIGEGVRFDIIMSWHFPHYRLLRGESMALPWLSA